MRDDGTCLIYSLAHQKSLGRTGRKCQPRSRARKRKTEEDTQTRLPHSARNCETENKNIRTRSSDYQCGQVF